MPIYEYACQKCGNEYEELVSSSALKPAPCPKCGSGEVKKKFSVVGSIQNGKSSQPMGCPSGGSCASGSCPMAQG